MNVDFDLLLFESLVVRFVMHLHIVYINPSTKKHVDMLEFMILNIDEILLYNLEVIQLTYRDDR